MAHTNQPPSDKLLLEAVELRIGGYKWEAVAEKMHRAFGTIRKWPMRYPERWQAASERAEQRLAVDSNAESVVVLRNMLRTDDIKMRWQAAKTLVTLRLELGKLGLRALAAAGGKPPGPPVEKTLALLGLLEQFSDDELAQLAEKKTSIDPSPDLALPTAAV